MADKKVPYLAGCVFYLLLRTAAYKSTTPRQRMDGVKDDHKNPVFMSDLVYTFTGVHTNVPGSEVSNYREGNSEGTINVPFHDSSDIDSYDHVVRYRYQDALDRMCEFTTWHLIPDKREWLVKACLDVIENDGGILESDVFCIKSNGSFVSKAEIRNETVFEYQPFLLGVLHYILTKRSNKNAFGIPTLDANTEKVKYKERRYNGHLGESISRIITVEFYEKPVTEVVQETVPEEDSEDKPIIFNPERAIGSEKSDDEVIRDSMMRSGMAVASILSSIPQPQIDTKGLAKAIEPLAVAADSCKPNEDALIEGISTIAAAFELQKHEIAERIRRNSYQEESTSSEEIPGTDSSQTDDSDNDDKKTTVIHQQTNVIQNGNNNVNVTNNGTINFNF